jgi:hypothetical protein
MRLFRVLGIGLAAAAVGGLISPVAADARPDRARPTPPVRIVVHAPAPAENVGISGSGFVVDLRLRYPSLERAGFNGLQLTGPAGHNNIAPFPGLFGAGADEKVPGLVVLLSTANAGQGQNFAGVFNQTMVGDRKPGRAVIHDQWLVGAAAFGTGDSRLTVAVVDDLDGNGVYDDAPDVVPDADGDGDVDKFDLAELGVASNVVSVPFSINGAPA